MPQGCLCTMDLLSMCPTLTIMLMLPCFQASACSSTASVYLHLHLWQGLVILLTAKFQSASDLS